MFREINDENVAHTPEYAQYRKDETARRLAACPCVAETTERISDDLVLTAKRHYISEDDDMFGSVCEYEILRDGECIHAFCGFEDEANFCARIEHPDGNAYLVFRCGLYGYSVLNLSDLQVFDYYPAESFPLGETFIWCGLHFNPASCMLAVEGCYWAAPYGVFLVDFRHPMRAAKQVDLGLWVDEHTDLGYGIDFVGWEGEDLIVRGDVHSRDLRIRAEQCKSLLFGDKELQA